MNDLFHRFWMKQNLALFGLSRDENSFSRQIHRLLVQHQYAVYPINPNAATIDSIRCYANLDAITVALDGAIVVTNPKISLHVVNDLARKGIKDVWFQPDTLDDSVRELLEKNEMSYVYHCALVYHREIGLPQ